MATEVERLVTLLEARISGYEAGLRKASQQAEREARKIEGRFARMNSNLSRQFLASTTAINGALGTIGAGVSFGAIVNLGRSALQLADDLQDTSEQLGISTDALQVFRFAAAETGVEAGKMDQAILKLSTTIGDAASGDEAATKKFKALGIAFRDDVTGGARTAEAVLADLADLIAALPTPAERAAAAAELLGERAGPRLVPLLSQGAEGLRKYGEQARASFQVMSNETINELAKAQREIEKFTNGLTIAAGGFIGFMNDLETSARRGGAELKLERINGQIERLSNQAARVELGLAPGNLEKQRQHLAELREEQRKLQDFLGINQPQAHSGRGGRLTPPTPAATIDFGTGKAADVLADLQAELRALGLTNRERFIAEALRRAEADAASDQGKQIAAVAGQIFDEEKAIKDRTEAAKRAGDLAKKQGELAERQNEATQQRIADQEFEIQQQQLKLQGLERQAAIEAAIRDARQENPTISPAGVAIVEAQAAAVYDLVNALTQEEQQKKNIEDADARLNDLMSLRAALQEQLNVYVAQGNTDKIKETEAVLAGVNVQIAQAIDGFIAYWQMVGGTEADAAIAKLQALKLNLESSGQTAAITGQQINNMIASGATNALDQFAQSIANSEDAVDSLWQTFRQFAADFLRQIAMMIAQRAILNALGAGEDGGGGVGGFLATAIGSLFHSGGVAGRGRSDRRVPAAAFIGAPRLHNGNVPGLKSDEVAAILQKGEPVISLPQVRKARQAQQPSAAAMQPKFELRNYNLFDEGEVVSRALGTPVGQQAFINVVRTNSAAVRGALGLNQSGRA